MHLCDRHVEHKLLTTIRQVYFEGGYKYQSMRDETMVEQRLIFVKTPLKKRAWQLSGFHRLAGVCLASGKRPLAGRGA